MAESVGISGYDELVFDNSKAKFTTEQIALIRAMATALGVQAAVRFVNDATTRVASSVAATVVQQMVEKGIIDRAIADGITAGTNYTSEIIRDENGVITHVRRQVA